MKSWLVHYSSKYPGGRVVCSAESIDVWSSDGDHCVHIEKSGAGQWMDRSEEYGCRDRHDLSPLPKNARFMKLYPNGNVGHSEEYAERVEIAADLASKNGGKVPSLEELQKKDPKSVSTLPKGQDHDREYIGS